MNTQAAAVSGALQNASPYKLTPSSPAIEELLGNATSLAADCKGRVAEAENLRKLPAETIEDFVQSGLGKLLVPKEHGGAGAEMPDLFQMGRTLAHGCTSSAWTLSFYTLHNWMLSLFPQEAQEDVFNSVSVPLIPAPLAPTGRAVPHGDGYKLDGRWSWATGVMHANWIMIGAIAGPDEAPFPAMMLMPIEDIQVEDVWHMNGMRATGSNDVVASGVEIPAHRMVSIKDIYTGTSPGANLYDGAAFRWPLIPALSLAAAMPALGTAERMFDSFVSFHQERVAANKNSAVQVVRPSLQMKIGEAQVKLDAIASLLMNTAERVQSMAVAGERINRTERSRVRLAAGHIVKESREIVNLLTASSGGSAHSLNSPIQQAQRDVNTLSGHVIFDYDVSTEVAGAASIWIDPPAFALV